MGSGTAPIVLAKAAAAPVRITAGWQFGIGYKSVKWV